MASRALTLTLALAATALITGCLEYSPHALPTDPSEQDLNAKALARLQAEPPPGRLCFAVVGDTQRSFDASEDAVESILLRDDVQFVFQVGDFTNVGLLLEFRLMNDIFSRLHVPYVVVVGNHDHFSNGDAIYQAMFGPKNFTFTRGRVRFVVFDSNSVSHDFDGTVPDIDWVAGALAPSPDHDVAITVAHMAPGGGPLFDDRLTAPLRALLASAGVPLSLHGHAHRFIDEVHQGVRYVTADSSIHRSYVVVTQQPDGRFDIEQVGY
jgi:predicted phosphodiesterase